jgi:hypothetical protein
MGGQALVNYQSSQNMSDQTLFMNTRQAFALVRGS